MTNKSNKNTLKQAKVTKLNYDSQNLRRHWELSGAVTTEFSYREVVDVYNNISIEIWK